MPIKKSNNLGLNIFGGSGYTSILSTSNLFLKSDIYDNDLNLFLKSKPTGVAISHKTNWDFSLRPPVSTNYIANGDLEFSLKDFSSNPNDDYYSYTNGKNGIDYYLSANWEINDIVGMDDITILGISNWTSTEKIILDNSNTRNAKIYSYAIGKYEIQNPNGNLTYYPVNTTTFSTTIYSFYWSWDTSQFSCNLTSSGTLTISYPDAPVGPNGESIGATSQSSVINNNDVDAFFFELPYDPDIYTPTITWTGDPDIDNGICLYRDLPSTSTGSFTFTDPIPDGAVQVGDYYYFPSDKNYYAEYDKAIETITKKSYDIIFNLTDCPCGASPNTLIVEWNENGATKSEVVCNPTNGQTIAIQEYVIPSNTEFKPKVYIDGVEYDFDSCFTKGAVTESSAPYTGAIYNTVRTRFFNGSTWNWVTWYAIPEYLKSVPTYDYVVSALPAGSFVNPGSTKYIPPIYQSNRRLNFIITNLSSLFKVQSIQDNEYLDYSDIFIEVTYSDILGNCQFYNENLLYTDVVTDGRTKTYKFGGSILLSDLLVQNSASEDVNVLFDDESSWKIIVDSSKNTVGVLLSSYMNNWTLKRYAWGDSEIPSSINRNFIDGTLPPDVGVIDSKEVAIEDLKIYKIVNFPNCGKIDIYTKLTGDIEDVTSSVITSSLHGLQNGDTIKITSALSSTTSDKTNLNGIFSVIKIDENRFYIANNGSSTPLTIVNVGSISGTQWTKVDDSGWKYQTSIYSPCGKNGYSTKPMQLLTYQENVSHAGDDIYARGYEYTASIDTFINEGEDNYSLPEVKYPQGYFDGRRSWNNFYPFMRFSTNDATAFGIINGNKFGYCISMKKYSDTEYILMVTEPGAMESFQIIDFFNIRTTNVHVIPSYLPYGRIHFYKLTKSPKQSSLNIEYLKSVSKLDNPWATYETNNRNLKQISSNKTYNYPINKETILLSYNQSTNSYWIGSRYVSWAKNYNYNQTYNVYLPDVENNPYEFGYVDFFGKSADFTISGDTIYCIASTNVKSANFLTNSRVSYVDTTMNYFSYDIVLDEISSIQSINNQNTTQISNPVKQYEEYASFGTKVVVNGDRVFWGWPGEYKESDYLYYYKRNGNSYSLKQTLSSNINSGFGSYIVSKGDFLITNKRSYTDDSGSLTVSPIDYIQVYRYYSLDDVYAYDSRISPTIDLSNTIYSTIDDNLYEETNNISYDGTTSNSASYLTSLFGRYDLYDNILILRDPYEISYLHYNHEINRFEPKGHQFIGPNDAKNTVIKVFSSYAAAFLDAPTEYDLGEFSSSLQIVNGSQFVTTSELLYGISTDIQAPEYLPIFLKNIEGYGSGSINLHMQANHSSGNLELFYKVFDGSSENLELLMYPPVPESGNVQLLIQGKTGSSGVVNLRIANTYTSNSTDLFLQYEPRSSGFFPLFVSNPITIFNESNVVNMSLEASYTGIPNASGLLLLGIKTDEYDDYASYLPLYFEGNKTYESGLNLNIYSAGGSSSGEIGAVELFINSDRIPYSGFMPLFIDKAIGENLNLIVYNTVVSSGINLYSSGMTQTSNGLEIAVSGSETVHNRVTFYTRGNV